MRANATPTAKKSLTTMTTYRSISMNTLYEALARARTLQPQGEANEDNRARRVAMRAKARQARELGEAQSR